MKARQICLYLALGTGFVFAQSDIKPEIRGTVTEPNLNIGVAGAEITLFEFLLDADRTVVRTQISDQLLNRAEKVTLQRGDLKDIALKLIDASQ